MLFFAQGSPETSLTAAQARDALRDALTQLGPRPRVLAVPPDATRIHSQAGLLTRLAGEFYGDRLTDVLPALGTHAPMTPEEIARMFPGVPQALFRVHDWRRGIVNLGDVPADFVKQATGGAVDWPWPAQVDTLLAAGRHDLILSIGQIVPHEVVGMAGYNKNIFVGTGGQDGINKSHFIGAVCGMERMMGRADTPVRRILNYASDHFARRLPIVYVLTVVRRDTAGALHLCGLFVGDDAECFRQAAALSAKVNTALLDRPLRKVVVYLDPAEFKTLWLGNKSIYRTRMAIADGGELVVLAPGVRGCGEDPEIDRLVRKYGYVGTPAVLKAVRENGDLRNNLSAAAHLIHGSSEGRFTITYCPGGLTQKEIESVGFAYGNLDDMQRRYDPARLKDGPNTLADGEDIFYISNPALGLWAHRKRFDA